MFIFFQKKSISPYLISEIDKQIHSLCLFAPNPAIAMNQLCWLQAGNTLPKLHPNKRQQPYIYPVNGKISFSMYFSLCISTKISTKTFR